MLNNINDITDWMLNHTNLNNNQFKIDLETLEVSILYDVNFRLKDLIVPIKIKEINGNVDIYINNRTIKTPIILDFLPEKINGHLDIPDLYLEQNSFDNWKVKEINGFINMCSKKSNIENLDFLQNTTFEFFYLKIGNTPFKDDIIPEEFISLKNPKLFYENYLKISIKQEDILNYFHFENEIILDKEI